MKTNHVLFMLGALALFFGLVIFGQEIIIERQKELINSYEESLDDCIDQQIELQLQFIKQTESI